MAEHLCPVWVGYFLANPLRKLAQHPYRLLSPYLKPGMTALDIGCAMGFFTIPMIKMVQPGGRIIAVDIQAEMIEKLHKKLRKNNFNGYIETRICSEDSFSIDDLQKQVDFVLLFDVLHEIPQPIIALKEISVVLKQGGILFFVEPKGHVKEDAFKTALDMADKEGLLLQSLLKINYSHAALLVKQ